jgi:hypothetical protein
MHGARQLLLIAAAGAALAGFPAPGARAESGLWESAIPVCEIQVGSGTLVVHGFLILHAQGYLLSDASCPDKNLVIPDSRAIYRFMQEVDSSGERFGNPLGEGTWGEIHLQGSIAPASGRLTFNEVVRYERHDVIDPRWAAGASEHGPGPRERSFDAALAESPQPRRIDGRDFLLAVDGEVTDAEATALLALAAPKNPQAISICRLTPAQSYVRLLCHWQASGWTDVESWVFARHGKSWKLMKHMDGVVR